MASVEKFSRSGVVNHLRHIERTISHSSNMDIDPDKTSQNYSLIEDRDISSYDYFLQRTSELYCYNRADVKVMAGWIVTAPQDLIPNQYDDFFRSTYNFLSKRYGENNVVQAIVHADESGQPHLHFYFIPAIYDAKHNREKICANEVLNKKDLRSFHTALQKHLKDDGISASVLTGITKAQGGNKSVWELKQERTHKYEHDWTTERSRW